MIPLDDALIAAGVDSSRLLQFRGVVHRKSRRPEDAFSAPSSATASSTRLVQTAIIICELHSDVRQTPAQCKTRRQRPRPQSMLAFAADCTSASIPFLSSRRRRRAKSLSFDKPYVENVDIARPKAIQAIIGILALSKYSLWLINCHQPFGNRANWLVGSFSSRECSVRRSGTRRRCAATGCAASHSDSSAAWLCRWRRQVNE